MSRARRIAALAVTLLATLAVPSLASAATDRWVDADTGSDTSNDCTVQATPCETISRASTSSQIAGNSGTIHVDQGVYDEHVNLAQSNVLTPDDFVAGDSGPTRIAYTGAGVAAFAQASATIEGFEIIGSGAGAVALVSDNATLRGNTIVATANNATAVDARSTGTATPTVEGNTILADSGDEAVGIVVNATTPGVRILDNEIGEPGAHGFDKGIWVRDNASATITGNKILGGDQFLGNNAKGIMLERTGDVTISRNLIASPVIAPGNESDGIYVNGMVDGADGFARPQHRPGDDRDRRGRHRHRGLHRDHGGRSRRRQLRSGHVRRQRQT